MSLFLDEKTKEEKAVEVYGSHIMAGDVATFSGINGMKPEDIAKRFHFEGYLAGWNECEKHVRESVGDAADLRSCMCSRFIIEIEQLKAKNEHLKLTTIHFFKKGHAIAKASSLIEIEQLKAENAEKDKEMAAWKKQCIETEKESKLRGEIIQSLEAQIKELNEALIDFNHALNYSISQLGGCECDQSVGFTCGTCCVDRDYQKHQSLINKIKESGK